MQKNPVGILMLDTSFERLPGDIGNPSTWPFPVVYQVIDGLDPATMIASDGQLCDQLTHAADALVAQGACAITTTCGFLGLYQQALASHCSVPVVSSALLQIAVVDRLLPGNQRSGILTYSEDALTDSLLNAVGAPVDTPRLGFDQQSVFFRWINGELAGQPTPHEQLRQDVVGVAQQLIATHADIGAIVTECTNLSPFIDDIAAATKLPVYDIVSQVNWMVAGLLNRGPLGRH